MQMKKSQLQVTKAYYSKHLRQLFINNTYEIKKKYLEYMCCYCTVIYNWVGGVILIKQYADKGRKDAYMDAIAFPEPLCRPTNEVFTVKNDCRHPLVAIPYTKDQLRFSSR